MLQGCYRLLLIKVCGGVLLRDLGGVQGCNQTTKFSILCDLGFGVFFLFAFASGSLVCHNSVEDPVGFNCTVSVT